jgi:rubredoxin
MSTFETFDKASGMAASAKLECGICWHVYDPADGDDVQQVPAGTAFADLPDDWTCPNCDAPQSKFMVVEDGAAG